MKASENVNDDNGVFCGTKVPHMLDSAWLAIQTKTQKNEPTMDANFVEPSQKRRQQLAGHNHFSLDEETVQQICSNPDPETAFSVMGK